LRSWKGMRHRRRRVGGLRIKPHPNRQTACFCRRWHKIEKVRLRVDAEQSRPELLCDIKLSVCILTHQVVSLEDRNILGFATLIPLIATANLLDYRERPFVHIRTKYQDIDATMHSAATFFRGRAGEWHVIGTLQRR
jgi:hypothetical protein